MLEAGLYFLESQHRPTDIAEQDIMQAAVISMGLDDLKPFNVKDKVVELLIGD
jgi:glutamate formiminotransferase/formiminotetrahydrofolate cyclodeaminase